MLIHAAAIMAFGAAPALAALPGGSRSALRPADAWLDALSPGASARMGGPWAENFEVGFTLGNLPQNGWTAALDPRAIISDVFTLEGARSLRHMADSSGFTEFALRSPVLENRYGRLTASVMRGSPNSEVQFITVDTALGNFNTRVSFDTDGRILVGQLNATQDAFDLIDTGLTWEIFQIYSVGVETDEHGALRVFIDDELAFEGVETSFALHGKAGRIGQWLMWTDNQTTGRPDGRGDSTTWDAFRFDPAPPIPAPGGACLLVGGALVATRRRR